MVEWKLLGEVVAMCYSYRDYRKEEARRERQAELRRERGEQARQGRKKFADREKVLVKT